MRKGILMTRYLFLHKSNYHQTQFNISTSRGFNVLNLLQNFCELCFLLQNFSKNDFCGKFYMFTAVLQHAKSKVLPTQSKLVSTHIFPMTVSSHTTQDRTTVRHAVIHRK